MSALTRTKIFNQPQSVVETWYWAMKSKDLKKGQVKPLNFLGRELAVYRGEDGVARAVDAYCPHMGAHLAEGTVDGRGLRCFFHHWKYDEQGWPSKADEDADGEVGPVLRSWLEPEEWVAYEEGEQARPELFHI